MDKRIFLVFICFLTLVIVKIKIGGEIKEKIYIEVSNFQNPKSFKILRYELIENE